MPLILTATLQDGSHPPGVLKARFDRQGGTLGRSSTNHLVLPDQSHQISRVQGLISCVDGQYLFEQQGQNPVKFNDRQLRGGERIRLNSGDRLLIGPYLISVNMLQEEAPAGTSNAMAGTPVPTSDETIIRTVAPSKDKFADTSIPSAPEPTLGALSDISVESTQIWRNKYVAPKLRTQVDHLTPTPPGSAAASSLSSKSKDEAAALPIAGLKSEGSATSRSEVTDALNASSAQSAPNTPDMHEPETLPGVYSHSPQDATTHRDTVPAMAPGQEPVLGALSDISVESTQIWRNKYLDAKHKTSVPEPKPVSALNAGSTVEPNPAPIPSSAEVQVTQASSPTPPIAVVEPATRINMAAVSESAAPDTAPAPEVVPAPGFEPVQAQDSRDPLIMAFLTGLGISPEWLSAQADSSATHALGAALRALVEAGSRQSINQILQNSPAASLALLQNAIEVSPQAQQPAATRAALEAGIQALIRALTARLAPESLIAEVPRSILRSMIPLVSQARSWILVKYEHDRMNRQLSTHLDSALARAFFDAYLPAARALNEVAPERGAGSGEFSHTSPVKKG